MSNKPIPSFNVTLQKRELDFIDGLGKWSISKQTRIDLLRKYLASMHLRTEWGPIDEKKVRKHVRKAIWAITGETPE